MWATAIFYGIPAALVSPQRMDIVLLGRSITAVFAVTLLVALYEIVRKLTADRLLGLFSVCLLLTSRSFLFTSHSARYDILSALAIVVGIYLLLRMSQPLTTIKAGVVGFGVAATMLITIHVMIALALASFINVLYHSRKQRARSFIAFVAGMLAFLVVLVVISALRGQFSLLGSAGSGSFALNIHDIPALRIYSRSVQFANIAQRWSMFNSYGFGYLVMIGAVALTAMIQYFRKVGTFSVSVGAVTIAVVLGSWFEFESAAPSSYIIYMLPVLSLAVALAMKRVLHEQPRIIGIALASILLFVFAFRDVPGARGKGYRLMTSNSLAVSAALAEAEQLDSVHYPLVLTFNPAVHEVMRDTNVLLMTTHFIEYATAAQSVDSVLRGAGVDYVLLYASALKPDYMREVGPIRTALARTATPIWERPGYFTDIGRSYFDTTLGLHDTVRLYHINKTK